MHKPWPWPLLLPLFSNQPTAQDSQPDSSVYPARQWLQLPPQLPSQSLHSYFPEQTGEEDASCKSLPQAPWPKHEVEPPPVVEVRLLHCSRVS